MLCVPCCTCTCTRPRERLRGARWPAASRLQGREACGMQCSLLVVVQLQLLQRLPVYMLLLPRGQLEQAGALAARATSGRQPVGGPSLGKLLP